MRRTKPQTFTKRLIFSGWALVPKVVSALVSFEAERRAFAGRSHQLHAPNTDAAVDSD